MRQHHIYARLTHKYVNGWKDLDRHEYVATVKLTPRRVTSEDDDGGYTAVTSGRVTSKALAQAHAMWRHLPAELRGPSFRRWFANAVASEFDHGCRCEHDCCGHYQSYGTGRMEGRTVVVRIRAYRNL